jgi:hypothetical protein
MAPDFPNCGPQGYTLMSAVEKRIWHETEEEDMKSDGKR